jgi:hydroxyacylglutathione hydrolase
MSEHGDLIVEAIVNGPFQENCYLVGEAQSSKAWLIDPGDEAERIVERVQRRGLQVEHLLCTHGHIDHAGAVAPLKRALGVPFSLHPAERPWLAHLPSQAAMFGLPAIEVPEVDHELADGQTLQLGALQATVLFTPGHTAGGCCLHFPSHGVVFVGDTLFEGSIGRTDLPGGSLTALLASIRDKLLVLADDVIVYSGHGPRTTIGAERAGNPFIQPGAVMLD